MNVLRRAASRKRRSGRASRAPLGSPSAWRICRIEDLERRQLLAADLILGSVYLEPGSNAAGIDQVGNTFTVTWQGGAPGTQLTRLVIDTDLDGDGQITRGEPFFDIAPGGPGAPGFGSHPFQLVDHAGFQVTQVSVVDGGSKLELHFSDFDPGERLVFQIDIDEATFTSSNAVVEGEEFAGSRLIGTFTHPDYLAAEASDTFSDFFNPKLVGSGLSLPDDDYDSTPGAAVPVYTAGAVARTTQMPLPGSLQGFVYVDQNQDGLRQAAEPHLAGVIVELLDEAGFVRATTATDAAGSYRFEQLIPGRYAVRERQPAGYLDGAEQVGSLGGTAILPDSITNIFVGSNQHGVQYNFGELLPARLSGHVYLDSNGDGRFQPGEQPLSNVVVELLDDAGTRLELTTTDGQGFYQFADLVPGRYQLREWQPTGLLDGREWVGTAGGVAIEPDTIIDIVLASGVDAVDYDFGEHLPASLAGRVYLDVNRNGQAEVDEPPLSGVVVQLLDPLGRILDETTTDDQGAYRFTQLRGGNYQLRELQPAAYLDGAVHVGSLGGVASTNLIRSIPLADGLQGVDYDFGEQLPPVGSATGSLSGYVFQDGPAIRRFGFVLPPAETLANTNDGLRTADDRPLAGVTLVLADSAGEPLRDEVGLLRTATTDAAGFYRFERLLPGSYSVLEVQPRGLIDGVDHAGTTGGSPRLPGDAILGIPVVAGFESSENNFSELLVVDENFFLPPPPEVRLDPPARELILPEPSLARFTPSYFIMPATLLDTFATGAPAEASWHLSVINGGRPRGERLIVHAQRLPAIDWEARSLTEGRWTLRSGFEASAEMWESFLGACGAIPVTGDFNGDGICDVGVYLAGEWFIDLNGNGRWDRDDLWIRLGSAEDRPVTGDWDGDGKTDVGILGPEWLGDDRAIAAEPGLPDPDNLSRAVREKNLPPKPQIAPEGQRELQRTDRGEVRADLIDHVFRFGTSGDIPLAGNWNGTGVDTVGVFRDGQWSLDLDGDGRFGPNDASFVYGEPGDFPLVGDFNGDGIDQVGVYRNGNWYLDLNGDRTLDERDLILQFGQAGDIPVVGDFDGDGRDDPGLFTPCVGPTPPPTE